MPLYYPLHGGGFKAQHNHHTYDPASMSLRTRDTLQRSTYMTLSLSLCLTAHFTGAQSTMATGAAGTVAQSPPGQAANSFDSAPIDTQPVPSHAVGKEYSLIVPATRIHYPKGERERGEYYQNFALALLQSKDVIGWHWFKYQDNDPNDSRAEASNRDANKGVLNIRYQPYSELLESMKQINTDVYSLADYFDRRPQ